MRIKNIGKFIRSVVIMSILLLAGSLLVVNSALSHEELEYKKMYTSQGDTIWTIAKEEKGQNSYYQNKDVRYIVNDLKEINHIEGNLQVGQEIVIPTI